MTAARTHSYARSFFLESSSDPLFGIFKHVSCASFFLSLWRHRIRLWRFHRRRNSPSRYPFQDIENKISNGHQSPALTHRHLSAAQVRGSVLATYITYDISHGLVVTPEATDPAAYIAKVTTTDMISAASDLCRIQILRNSFRHAKNPRRHFPDSRRLVN